MRSIISCLAGFAALALPFLGTTLVTHVAAADTPQQFHLDYPGAGCVIGGGISIWNGSADNYSTTNQYVECPITTDDSVGSYDYVAAFLSQTTSGASCWLGVSYKNGTGGYINATSVTFEPGYESYNFTNPYFGTQDFVDLECILPPNGKLSGYTVGQTWADWQ
jgi:hypothetical protein